MTFGQKFKMLVVKHRMRYEDFGFAGVQKSTVYRWAADKAFPNLKQLQQLARHFGVPIAYLADDNFESVDQVAQGITGEERQYVEMGRALGMKDAARLMGLVEVLVKEQSLPEVYRRLLKVEAGQEQASQGGNPNPGGGNPGVGRRAANVNVHAVGDGTSKGRADHKPQPFGH